MARANVKDLLEAGVHFGHLTRKWDPNMAPYIFMEKNGIHIIDLHKTAVKLEEAANALGKIASSGRKILFVATKKQAKEVLAKHAESVNMPYITERWMGGMLTNFSTIRKAVKKMNSIDRMKKDGTFETLSKRERLQIDRQRAKLERDLGSIADMTRLPSALFVVDVVREGIAVAEAQKLGIPIFAMVDTNVDPREVQYPIPSNDDASKSVDIILTHVADAIKEGLSVRKAEKERSKKQEEEKAEKAKAEKEAKAEKAKAEKDAEAETAKAEKEVKVEKAKADKAEAKKEAKTETKVVEAAEGSKDDE